MRIIGLCKTFSGNEFITAAIESLYGFLDAFVFVNSNVSWLGKTGNTVVPVIKKWQEENDVDKKIVHHECNATNQRDQYDIGYAYARKNFDPDWIMIFDSDEVWDRYNLEAAKRYMKRAVEYNSIACHMHTYLKSPFYRVDPPEMCKPTVFVRPIHYQLQGIRGNHTAPRLLPHDLFFHHFTYVRDREEDIFEKIQTSLVGDQDDVPMTQLVNIEEWKEKKWKNITRCKNLHTTAGFEPSWYRVQRININELPESCHNLPIVKKWENK